MPEPREARSILENAALAAADGNYSSAEELLRQAATLQEQTLGPDHPDLANTLNNLGVVCEMMDNPIDAEHYFRRAYTIANAALGPDHPFVVTSKKNLHDFCAARGRPMELGPSPPEVATWLEPPADRAVPPRRSLAPANKQDEALIPRKRSLRPLALGALGVAALLIVILMMLRSSGSGVEDTKAPSPTPPAESPPPEPTAAKPAANPQSTRRETDTVSSKPTPAKRSAAAPTVVTAQLCTSLKEWRCEAAENQVRPGPVFFYTQIKSPTATTVEHRWYQGDRLRQAVQLRIQANPGAGYRTYSRTTISREPVDGWRVELRSADGAVLQEVRFTAR